MQKKEFFIKLFLFVFCVILFSCNLGTSLPIIESEKFYFQSVKEMFARHDWLTPYYQGRFRFQKPILFYWLVGLSYLVFGVTNFGVRFPSAFFGALAVVFTFNIGRKLFDRKTGFLAGALLATFAMFFMYARYASPDMVLTFFVTYSIYLFLKATKHAEGPKMRIFVYFYIVLGLATLNKGYVGFALPLAVVFVYIAGTKKWRLLKAMNLPMGMLIILGVSLPWYLIMYRLHGKDFLDHIVIRETIMRIFYAPNNETGAAFMASYAKRFFYYIPIIFAWFLPYSVFLPAAIRDMFHSKNTYSREKDSYKLMLSFFFGIFIFFTLVSVKEYHYMLPAAPACSLIIARHLINLQERSRQFKGRVFALPYFLITILYVFCATGLVYTMRHIYPENVRIYDYGIILAPLVLIVPFLKRNSRSVMAALPAAIWVLMIFMAARAVPMLNDDSMRYFAQEISGRIREGDRIGVGSINISQQRMGVYLDRKIEEVNVKWNAPEAMSMHRDKIQEFFSTKTGAYLVISEADYDNIVPEDIKDKLLILDKKVTWKTRLKRSFSKDIFLQVLRGQKDILNDILRHNIYLVTNKKG